MAMTCRAVTHSQTARISSRPSSRRPVRYTVRPVASVSKSGLVAEVVQRTELKKNDVELVLNSILDVIMEKVASDQKVTLTGFGVFEARHRAARNGRNPQTGAPLQIEAKVVPAFSAGLSFKKAVAAGDKEAAPAPSE